MNETLTHYESHVVTARAWEEASSTVQHRRFAASYSIGHAASGVIWQETYLESIFVELDLAQAHALTLAKQEIDRGGHREAA